MNVLWLASFEIPSDVIPFATFNHRQIDYVISPQIYQAINALTINSLTQ
jgi:hypothetical protein